MSPRRCRRGGGADRRAGRAHAAARGEVAGDRVWLKCECLQTGGAFKLRGATNRLLQLSPEERARGVVAFSSGNHAQGVAIAARRLGIRAIIVMPADAPQVKVDGTRAEGAEIVFYDRRTESREEIAARIAARERRDRGAELRRSGDRRGAGHGRARDRRAARASPPPHRHPVRRRRACSGIALALSGREIVDRRARGLGRHGPLARAGRDRAGRSRMPPTRSATRCRRRGCRRSPSACSGARGRRRSAVSDAEVADAMRFAWQRHELVVEPGGAVGAGRAARGQGRAARGHGRRAVGRECRSGASRADRRGGLGDVARLIFAGLDVDRARALDRLGQLLELGGEGLSSPTRNRRSLSATDSEASISVRASSRCTAGSFPRSARTPLRGAPDGRHWHGSRFGPIWLSLGEIGRANGRIIRRSRWRSRWSRAFLLVAGAKLPLGRQTRGRGNPDDRRRARPRHERDDLDGVAGLIGSVASRMSR